MEYSHSIKTYESYFKSVALISSLSLEEPYQNLSRKEFRDYLKKSKQNISDDAFRRLNSNKLIEFSSLSKSSLSSHINKLEEHKLIFTRNIKGEGRRRFIHPNITGIAEFLKEHIYEQSLKFNEVFNTFKVEDWIQTRWYPQLEYEVKNDFEDLGEKYLTNRFLLDFLSQYLMEFGNIYRMSSVSQERNRELPPHVATLMGEDWYFRRFFNHFQKYAVSHRDFEDRKENTFAYGGEFESEWEYLIRIVRQLRFYDRAWDEYILASHMNKIVLEDDFISARSN